MPGQLFRKVSLERLSSPEQLDVLMRVTSPTGWLALLGFGLLLAAALFWGVYGSIDTTVTGSGILLKTGGVLNVESLASGQVSALYVKPGSTVSRGQLVARVAQPKILDDINQALAELRQLKEEYERKCRYGEEEIRLKVESFRKRKVDTEHIIQNQQERLKWLRERLASQQKLLDEGLVRKQDVVATQKDIYDATDEVETQQRNLKQITIDELELKQNHQMELLGKEQEISRKELQIAGLEDDLELKSRLTVPYTGRIVEISTSEGAMVNFGDKLMTLELTGEDIKELEAVLYFPPGDGKKIVPGMKVQIAPSTVKQEEWGCMIGMVISVSPFPATDKGMLRNLQNDKLVEAFSKKGPPIEVYADLIPAPTTASGYKWSSSGGPPVRIEHGTVCYGTVSVDERPPISLVIPLFKKWFLGVGSEKD
ncbi:MAG: NHLP bacteriocin system secretion protein [Acidobacteriota bacterium]